MAAVVTPSEGLDLCQRRHVNLRTVFGSAARGEPEPPDLDLAVQTEHGADFDLFGFVTDVIDLVGLEHLEVDHGKVSAAIPHALEQYGQYVQHVGRWPGSQAAKHGQGVDY